MTRWIFGFIIILAVFLRLYQLDNVPPHPSLDEVSIGYNAYSILRTGADEYGTKFPILLRAYDDWRPALYVYLVIPFVKLFGLSIFAVRIPSVILSVLTIVMAYFLVKTLVSKYNKNFIKVVSLSTIFLLAISPWHIYMSRLGHEVNGSLAFFVFGFYFFAKYLGAQKPNMKVLLVSAIFFALSFNFYQSAKIFIPLFLLLIAFLFRKKLFQFKKNLILPILVGFLIALPIIVQGLTPNGLIRFKTTSIIAANPQVVSESAKLLLKDKEDNNYLGLIINNRRVGYGLLMGGAYISHFNPYWLVGNTGNEIFKTPNKGLMHGFELALMLIGIVFIFKTKLLEIRYKIVFLGWGLIAVLPAAITTDAPHAMRILNILPLPQIFGAFGLAYLLEFILKQKKQIKVFVVSCLILLFSVNIYNFYHSYFVELPKQQGNQFSYSVLQALEKVEQLEDNYSKIIISSRGILSYSYMFYLFATQFDPDKYQTQGGTISGGFATTHIIGKYHFMDPANIIDNELDTLYVLDVKDIVLGNNIISKIKFENGVDSIIISDRK
jgi:4-amino-4-deoxy-L-arabinose transferase-like glycosyltransferase